VMAFHAGTRRATDGDLTDERVRLVTSGGRVLTVVGSDRDAVYAAAQTIRFAGKQFRSDIGRDEANHLTGGEGDPNGEIVAAAGMTAAVAHGSAP